MNNKMVKDIEELLVGEHSSRRVHLGVDELLPAFSQSVVNHSPDGFSWGYGGSGPSQLALAILLELMSKNKAVQLYQQFKVDVIANFPMDEDFEYPVGKILEWIKQHGGK